MPITLAAALVAASCVVAANWPGFTVRSVEVVGNDRISAREIVARADISPRSIWLQNTRAIARRVAEIPYVGAVRIYRLPPSTLRISVRERIPFATLQSPPASVVVDRDLRVLQDAPAEQQPVLMLAPGIPLTLGAFVTAHQAVGLRNAYDALRAGRLNAQTLAWDRYGGLVATLPGGLTILLGPESDLSQRITLVDAIITQVVHNQHRERRVAAIDVRAPATPVVVYR